MKIIVIFATLVACCFAAPALDLQHPSPINPSVLVEVKPQEKVVLITDPLEIAKFKREVPQPLYPTILPEDRPHHIAKRDHKPGHESKSDHKPNSPTPPKKTSPTSATTKKPAQKHSQEPPKTPSINKRNRRDVETHEKPQKSSPKPLILPATLAPETHSAGLQKPQTLPAIIRERRDVETHEKPHIGFQKPLILPVTLAPETVYAGFQKPQTLPNILPQEASESTHHHKRDIPVPLVAKYQHPEVSPKESSEEKSDEDSKEDTKVKSDKESEEEEDELVDDKEDKKEKDHENHPNKDEVQVEDLSEPKPLHQTLNFNHDIPSEATTTDDEKKPNIYGDHLGADEITNPIEHHLTRPKPVPVAELFARAHED